MSDGSTQTSFRIRREWQALIAAIALLLATPGPERTPFSGLPFSTQTLVLFVSVAILTVFSAFFPARRRVGTWPLVLLVALIAAKALLSSQLVTPGWHATYWTKLADHRWKQARFQGEYLAARDFRVDRTLDFDGETWGLHFINEQVPSTERTDLPRDHDRPMHVRWAGHASLAQDGAFATVLTASGRVIVTIDGEHVVTVQDPDAAAIHHPLDAGTHVLSIEYFKPPRLRPRLQMAATGLRVTPFPSTADALNGSEWRARAATVAGFAALLLALGCIARAYRPLSRLVLHDVWAEPKKLAATAFFAYVVLAGLQVTIGRGISTSALTAGDDWLAYQGNARAVLFNGLLMVDDAGAGKSYHHYPLYSYALAAAHVVFGEEFSSVIMFNYLCLALLGVAVYFLLKRYVSGPALAVALALIGWLFIPAFQVYAHTSFSDNLYVLVVMTTLAVAVTALEQRSGPLLWLTGVLTALAAATRPSFLFFAPLFALLLLADRTLGATGHRVREAARYSFGFACGVAPFTLRNWVVANKFVLLVSSFVMLPYFLYPPGMYVPLTDLAEDDLRGSIADFVNIWREHPGRTAWVEARKVLFTFGLMDFGPEVSFEQPQWLFVWPLLFAGALAAGRIPRVPRNVLLVFAASHVIAMIVGAPWTYGYKTILPFHLAFLVGAAFLLPNWGLEWWRKPAHLPRRLPTRPRTVSVVLPTYNEKDSIREVIEDFFATGAIDEVVVINNNAAAGTSEEVAGTRAREILEARQGYGAAIRRGLAEARGEFIVICEPDGTFLARDVIKLLAFADDFDVVYGSRTSQQLIWHGANMGVFLRWGNWVVAKYMEFLYNATSLTDVGCTMRLIRREAAEQLRDKFRIDGSQFGPEMMVLSLKEQLRVIQIPVSYLPRVGESAVTGDLAKAFVLGLQMIWLITRKRFERRGAGAGSGDPVRAPRSPDAVPERTT